MNFNATLAVKVWPCGDFSVARPGLKGAKPLGLSLPANSRTEPRGRQGANGITAYGRRMVKSGCALVEDSSPRGCVSFATLTLPFTCPEQLSRAAHLAGEITNRLCEELRRDLIAAGLPGEIVVRIEPQSRGALHWHLIFQGRKSGTTWAVNTSTLDNIWLRVLNRTGNLCTSVLNSCNIQAVKKSSAGYMSKYMGKDDKSAIQLGEAHPSRWWGITNSIRNKVKNNIVKFSRYAGSSSIPWNHYLQTLQRTEGVVYCTNFTRDDLTICLHGRCTPDRIQTLLETILNLTRDPPQLDLTI